MDGEGVGRCRFYEQKFPKLDELVMVRVTHLAEVAAYVELVEYNNMEGMILFTELSRKRIRSIAQFIRVGKLETVQVLRVDEEQGYIDLSKKKVSAEDAAQCEARYKRSKMVNSILRNVAEQCSTTLEHMYETIGWPLARKYGHAYDALKEAVAAPEEVLGGLEMTEKVKEWLLKNIQMRLKPQPLRIRADAEITCFTPEGIEGIKYALRKGLEAGTEDIPVKIKLVSPPLYVFLATSLDREEGVTLVDAAVERTRVAILEKGGELVVQQKARPISERDERQMNRDMERAQTDLEKDGQDDSSDEEDESGASTSGVSSH